ncbi:hypothetical protein VTJ83DRAFT_6093 [Remersonia thermophila]|uniref:Rhodopsin domain-containing protein n=1 Tax=Remersonia thermophila TaxID=72144 RepID=A0ABR4D8S0_9PEZI
MASATDPDNLVMLSTVGHLMSVEAMKAILWAGFALCFLGFCIRSYIRWVCFCRLLPEDWIMAFALLIMGAACVWAQLRLEWVYLVEDVFNKVVPMPKTFLDRDLYMALHGILVQGILGYTGVHAVKLSFLLFFRRLGGGLLEYTIFWWVVAVVTLASYVVCMATIDYPCMTGSLEVLFLRCTDPERSVVQWHAMIAYCTVDVVSDILILGLPIVVLWRVRVTLRKKLLLGAIFSLTLLTVAVTIIRGTIHTGKVSDDGSQTQNIAWTWFWLSIQFITAYIIACLVSFRMLFVHNERNAQAAAYQQHKAAAAAAAAALQSPSGRPSRSGGSGSGQRRTFFDSLLDTFHDWEGTTRDGGDDYRLRGPLPDGHLSVDFSRFQLGDGTQGQQPQQHRLQPSGAEQERSTEKTGGQGKEYYHHQQQYSVFPQYHPGAESDGEWPLRGPSDEESGLRRPESARTLATASSIGIQGHAAGGRPVEQEAGVLMQERWR